MATTDLTLPDIKSLSSLPDEEITAALDLLFEPSINLHALVLPAIRSTTSPSLTSYADLISLVRSQLLALQGAASSDALAKETLFSILGAHPRLGAKKVESAQSAAEQAQLQAASGRGGSGEAEKLAQLNAEYEAKFPGLIYVVFVNGRSRDVIMENMRERIARGDFAREEVEAIEAMAAIAKDRAGKLPKATA